MWVNNVLPRLDFTPALIEPQLARLLGDVRGKESTGCRLRRRPAMHGISNTEALASSGSTGPRSCCSTPENEMRISRSRRPDLLDVLDFDNDSMDAIVSVGVLMSLPRLDTFLSESVRILKKRGALVIAVHHPAFCNPTMRLNQRFWEKWLRRPVVGRTLSYFGKGSGAESWPLYHRTIEEYVDAFRRQGLHIDRITEPHELPRELLERDRSVEYATRLPRFIVFKLVTP